MHLDDLVAVAPADHRLVALDPLAAVARGPIGVGGWPTRGPAHPASGGGTRPRARRGPSRSRSSPSPGTARSSTPSARPSRRPGRDRRPRRRGRSPTRRRYRPRTAALAHRGPGGRTSAGRCPCPAWRRRRGPGRAGGRRDRRRPRSRCRRAPGAAVPCSPAASSDRSLRITGLQADHIASIRNSPRSAASSNRAAVESASSVIGFSQSTAFPAARAIRACSSWRACGEATYTTSTAGSASSSCVGAVRRAAVLARERAGALEGPRSRRHQLAVGDERQVGRELVGDPPRRQHAPSDGLHAPHAIPGAAPGRRWTPRRPSNDIVVSPRL